MENVSLFLKLFFVLTTLLTVAQFYRATPQPKFFLTIIGVWMIFQAIMGFSGFYTEGSGFPPRFVLLAPPAILFIVSLFVTMKGRAFIDSLDIQQLTLLHAVRIPVELALYYLFLAKAIPEIMTFSGWNFDILSGLTAPLVYYFGFVKKTLNPKIILVWNVLCLALLFNIVIIAILSAPTLLQKWAFDQPNIAILYFPFVWLPSIVVPLVFLAHLASIRQLWQLAK